MMVGNLTRIGALCAGFLSATSAVAQDSAITLESNDGSIRLSGQLVEFDGESYTISTAIGTVIIASTDVTCSGDACPVLEVPGSEFTVSGSQALASSLLPALVEGYGFERDADMLISTGDNAADLLTVAAPDGTELAKVTLNTRGSSSGLRDLISGDAALAVTTRPVRDQEVQAALAAGAGELDRPPYESVLALDGLLVVTSQDNPVRALSEQNIADIFAGQITNWSQVGGENAPINVYARGEDTGTGAVFFNLVMLPQRLRVTPEAELMESDAAVSDAVAADPNGIGITSFSAERNAKSVAIRGVCGIQTPANAFTIKTEEYPLARRLYLYQSDRAIPRPATELVDYLASDEAQQIISQTGFVDQGVSSQSVNEMGLRFVSAVLPSDAESTLEELRGMMQDLVAADRLSITFRFEPGSARLDSRAEGDVVRLAEIINSGELRNKEILLIGYTDSVGRADINSTLSQGRAEQVRDALLAAVDPSLRGNVTISPIGYGEISPLGCNETANGRQINRRVEVWTRDIIR